MNFANRFKIVKVFSEGISISALNVISKKAELETGKKIGKYVIVDFSREMLYSEKYCKKLTEVFAMEVKKMLKRISYNKSKNILCVGVGNNQIIADSFGPKTIKRVIIQQPVNNAPAGEIRVFNPDIESKTGINTSEHIMAVAKLCKSDILITIDSLATDDKKRIGASLQLSSSMFTPGEGMGEKQKKTNNLLKLNCLSIGAVLVNVFSEGGVKYILMPCDEEIIVEKLAKVASDALNSALGSQKN